MEVARDKGYYKEFGIQPEFQMYSSGAPQNEALASDKWKTGVLGMASILASIRYGAKIVAIADFEGKLNTLFVRSNSDILKVKGYFKDNPDLYGSPETIKGKTIITTVGTSAHYTVERLVSTFGLKMTDVKVLNMDQPSAAAAFTAGQGDIVILWSPYTWGAENKGFVKMGDITQLDGEIPAVIVASKKAVENEPEMVTKWVAGFVKATAYMKPKREETIAGLGQFLNRNGFQPNSKQLAMEYDLKPIFTLKEQLDWFTSKNGKTPIIEAHAKITKFLVSQGIIKAEEEKWFLENAFDDRFLKNAATLEGLKN
jgi:ABC-type nitrate/sulfonate/bicarbonate transport system substrate-binding protein